MLSEFEIQTFHITLQLPGSGDLFSYFVDFDTRRLEPWEKIIPSFKYSADIPYFDLLVPTVDTVRYGFLMEKLLAINRSVMYTGTTGVGKVRVFKALFDIFCLEITAKPSSSRERAAQEL